MRNDVLLRRSLGFKFEGRPAILDNLVFYLPLEAADTYNLTDLISGNAMEFSDEGSCVSDTALWGMVKFITPGTIGDWVGRINTEFHVGTFPNNEFTIFSYTYISGNYASSSTRYTTPVVLSPTSNVSLTHGNNTGALVTTTNSYYAAFCPCPPTGTMKNSDWNKTPALYWATLSESGRTYSQGSATGTFGAHIPYLPLHFLSLNGEYPEGSGLTFIGSDGYLYFGANVLSNTLGTVYSISNYAIFNKVLTADEIQEFSELVESGKIADLLPM